METGILTESAGLDESVVKTAWRPTGSVSLEQEVACVCVCECVMAASLPAASASVCRIKVEIK